MDEQIKPVAWAVGDKWSKTFGYGNEPVALYSQQSIDALRAEVEFHKRDASALRSQMDVLRDGLASERERAESMRAELAEQCRLHAIGMERELALIGRADRAEAEAAAKQARIDELMLEYCPDEMTPEQIENWKRHQVPAIDAARKGE